MSLLLTLCARGGSKGVQHKNVREVHGKPLMAYTIGQALQWGRASHVVVSTDSEQIAKIARTYGAEVPFLRPSGLAADDTPKVDALRHALKNCEEYFGEIYETVVDLDVTAPVRRVQDIENCYQKFMTHRPLTLFSVVPARRNPYFNMVEENEQGFAQVCKPLPNGVTRRQDAPLVYDMNASIYVYQRAFLLDPHRHSPLTERSMIYVMDDSSGFDVDGEFDLKIIELLLKDEGMKVNP